MPGTDPFAEPRAPGAAPYYLREHDPALEARHRELLRRRAELHERVSGADAVAEGASSEATA